MAFAMGTDNFGTLDEMVINLMDLAQTRGGDQVAVQRAGEEVKYFGGSSEAIEKMLISSKGKCNSIRAFKRVNW